MGDEYEYKPLKSDSAIRLLRIISHHRELLQCELLETPLAQAPAYEAVSYTWGSESTDHFVICDNKRLATTRNCEAALRYLQSHILSTYLWIDGVCIDQRNVDERNQQVEIMGEVYHRASRVVVWLGSGDADCDLAFKFLSSFAPIMGKKGVERDTMVMERMIELQELNRRSRLSPPSSILQGVFDKSWFERMWTIQEVVMAEDSIVLCGQSEIPWELLVFALDRMAKYQFRTTGMDLLEGRLSLKVTLHRALSDLIHGDKGGARVTYGLRRPSLSTIMAHAQGHQATDPKDKVYALYGILKALKVPLPSADYSKDIAQIYLETTSCVMAHDASASILCNISGSQRIPNLPSWVPDFSDACPPAPISEPAFAASTHDSKPDIFASVPLRRLFIKARIVDEVASRAECSPLTVTDPKDMSYFQLPLTRDLPKFYAGRDGQSVQYTPASQPFRFQTLLANRADEIVNGFIEWIYMWQQLPLHNYPGGGSSSTAFYRLLVQDGTMGTQEHHPHRFRDGFVEWYKLLVEPEVAVDSDGEGDRAGNGCDVISAMAPLTEESTEPLSSATIQRESPSRDTPASPPTNPGSQSSPLTTQDPKPTGSPHLSILTRILSHPTASIFQYHALLLACNKTLFITRDGYMGTGSVALKEGDKVALFPGLPLPFIVRPVAKSVEDEGDEMSMIREYEKLPKFETDEVTALLDPTTHPEPAARPTARDPAIVASADIQSEKVEIGAGSQGNKLGALDTMPPTNPRARAETQVKFRTRQRWNEYVLLGPAYVQGIMSGERWPKTDNGDSEGGLEELVIV